MYGSRVFPLMYLAAGIYFVLALSPLRAAAAVAVPRAPGSMLAVSTGFTVVPFVTLAVVVAAGPSAAARDLVAPLVGAGFVGLVGMLSLLWVALRHPVAGATPLSAGYADLVTLAVACTAASALGTLWVSSRLVAWLGSYT